jgi:hypothetical protein
MYLLNLSKLIDFAPYPATLFITYLISSSLKLNLNCYDILFRSSNYNCCLPFGSTSLNIAFLPSSLYGFPFFNINKYQF